MVLIESSENFFILLQLVVLHEVYEFFEVFLIVPLGERIRVLLHYFEVSELPQVENPPQNDNIGYGPYHHDGGFVKIRQV